MSSGSESDEEFIPGEPEQLSEEESADEETDLHYEKELETKKKRKAVEETKNKKRRKTRHSLKETTVYEKEEREKEMLEPAESVEEKKKEDDLWAKFLEGTDVKPKATEKEKSKSISDLPTKSSPNVIKKPEINDDKNNKEDNKAREKRIFEFAGETIVVENNVIKEKIKSTDGLATVTNLDGPRARGSGGLSNVLDSLNKKNQLSTLEKSKLDWETYKKKEGIEDEIESHNKGKNGYLDRQDFLERADHRQYEIERDLRMTRRSNR